MAHVGSAATVDGAELQALVDAISDRQAHWRAFLYCTGWLGWRWSEGLGIRRRDVDLLRQTVRIGDVVIREADGQTYIKDHGKTDAASRTVPLPPTVARALAQHMQAHVPGSSPDDFLFRTEQGLAPLRSNFARQVLKPALVRAGLEGRGITFHKLRDTAASLMLDAGLALQDTQERLGHSRPSTTLDVYAHSVKGRQEAGTAALEAAISRASKAG